MSAAAERARAKSVHVSVNPRTFERLQELESALGLSRSSVISQALAIYYARNKKTLAELREVRGNVPR